MITLSKEAKLEFTNYFEGRKKHPVRVYMGAGDETGPRLSLAVDELRDGDKTVKFDSLTFVIHKELAKATGEVAIGKNRHGFTLDSENLVGGCDSCGC